MKGKWRVKMSKEDALRKKKLKRDTQINKGRES